MEIAIKHRYKDNILLRGEYESIKNCLEKNKGANLEGAYLRGANLRGAKGITLPIITIAGSRHEFYYHNGKIQIGCNILTVNEWLRQSESLGKSAGYTDKEIAEYQQYIKLVDALVKANR